MLNTFYLLFFYFLFNFCNAEDISEEIKVVLLGGGLGNQMFQYAFGIALERKLGKKVLFDNTYFEYAKRLHKNEKLEDSNGRQWRNYGLDIFNLDIKFANEKELDIAKKNTILEKYYCYYDENILKNYNGSSYYKYNFQNEKYFKEYKNEIKRMFTFPEISKTDEFNQKWLNKIRSTSNSVLINIRRGDYEKIGWTISINYYKRAIEYIKKKVKDPIFFVICQHCKEYVEKEFNIDTTFEFIGEINSTKHEDWKDIVLMKECKYAIISNSTFAWWAAWLGRANEEGFVIAPTPFVKDKDDIICENWIKINSQ